MMRMRVDLTFEIKWSMCQTNYPAKPTQSHPTPEPQPTSQWIIPSSQTSIRVVNDHNAYMLTHFKHTRKLMANEGITLQNADFLSNFFPVEWPNNNSGIPKKYSDRFTSKLTQILTTKFLKRGEICKKSGWLCPWFFPAASIYRNFEHFQLLGWNFCSRKTKRCWEKYRKIFINGHKTLSQILTNKFQNEGKYAIIWDVLRVFNSRPSQLWNISIIGWDFFYPHKTNPHQGSCHCSPA